MFKAQHTIITPDVWYNFKTALTVHNFHSLGRIPCCLSWRYRQIHTQHILPILPGTHLYTWMESSNVDRVSCWRTKVWGIDWNRTCNPLIQSQGFTPVYTTAPPHTYAYDIRGEGGGGVFVSVLKVLVGGRGRRIKIGDYRTDEKGRSGPKEWLKLLTL